MKYYLSVGAIFKNEAHILKEWLDHYQFHGIDHIYLINDNSNDKYLEIIQPYIDSDYVTLFDTPKDQKKFLGIQEQNYNTFFKPIANESKWFAILDLDEFLYSPFDTNIKKCLSKHECWEQILVNWVHFGSSGFIQQPDKIVDNFIFRGVYNDTKNGPNGRYNSYKSIVQSKCLLSFKVHLHSTINNKFINLSEPNEILLINHYAIQSREYWMNIKMTRGDVNHYYDQMGWERNMKLFEDMDNNDVFDDRLKKQNTLIGSF